MNNDVYFNLLQLIIFNVYSIMISLKLSIERYKSLFIMVRFVFIENKDVSIPNKNHFIYYSNYFKFNI